VKVEFVNDGNYEYKLLSLVIAKVTDDVYLIYGDFMKPRNYDVMFGKGWEEVDGKEIASVEISILPDDTEDVIFIKIIPENDEENRELDGAMIFGEFTGRGTFNAIMFTGEKYYEVLRGSRILKMEG